MTAIEGMCGVRRDPGSSATCSGSLLKYLITSFIPIPYQKESEQKKKKKVKNNHSFVVIFTWVSWERRLRRRRGMVAM